MPVRHLDDPVTPQKWMKRRTIADEGAVVPVVRVLEEKELPPEELQATLADINNKQWRGLRQLLIEGKLKAESMLKDPVILDNPQKMAYYLGWVAYADFTLSSVEGVKSSWGESAAD